MMLASTQPPAFRCDAWSTVCGEHIRALAWSPDSTQVAAVTAAGELCVADVSTRALVHRELAHRGGALCAAWSANGTLATAGEDGGIRLWQPVSFAPGRELEGGSNWVEHLAWSPRGDWLANGAGRHLRLWQPDGSPGLRFAGHESTVAGLSWRSDGVVLATACYGKVRLFRPGTDEPPETLAHKSPFGGVALSPRGRYVVAPTFDNAMTCWRLPFREAEPLQMSGYPARIKTLAWSADSEWLATGAGPTGIVWRCSGKGPAGTTPLMLTTHRGAVTAMQFQGKGTFLATGSATGEVFIWHLGYPDAPVARHNFAQAVSALAWSPTDQTLAVAGADGALSVLQVQRK
ncbi:MAG: hypothetical protein B9S33_05345 [Pedosphaera sp. Tous-C6FEB]|nr:MAG: hypothetical protein B9S33_05345 [Pedosphaera sp. Tous-C6FEB]